MRLFADPFARALVTRLATLTLVLVLLVPFGRWAVLTVGLLGALVVTGIQVAGLQRVRERIGDLAAEAAGERGASERSEPTGLEDLALRVELARESLAQARRKAEHERDDVLGILGATSEGILVIGHSQRVEMLNDAARQLLRPSADPLGRSLQEVVRNRELARFIDGLRRGEPQAQRTIELELDGRRRIVSLSGSVVRSDRLRQRVVVVLNDLSELARLDQVRTDFVANVTHEMRSPLASILGYAETLQEEELDDDARDFVARILRNAQRLDDIIRDLIELSRLEHDTGPRIESVDVQDLLEGIANRFRDAARDKELTLTVDTSEVVAHLPLDAGLIKQAITNLCDNAVKYTPIGGSVRLRAHVRREPAEELWIEVADSGKGIPRTLQTRIFERFYRVDTGRSRSVGGTGLGLAIVKHATALHGGRVTLESGDAGSTFTVIVPFEPVTSTGGS